MNEYVKIEIRDEVGKLLMHQYLREDEWNVPAGKIEKDETPAQAATRELFERTGYAIDETKLILLPLLVEDYYIFKGSKSDLIRLAEPGEKGGYSTQIRWD